MPAKRKKKLLKKRTTIPNPLTGVEVVETFLSMPKLGQETMLIGLEDELINGDKDIALELLGHLQRDERCQAIIDAFQDGL